MSEYRCSGCGKLFQDDGTFVGAYCPECNSIGTPTEVIRLFRTETGPLEESVTPDGSQANLRVEQVIGDIVKWADVRGYSLRDFEILLTSEVHNQIARAILLRRRNRLNNGR